MSLAIPKKKRVIIIIVIISLAVKDLLDINESDTPQEQVLRLVGHADYLMDWWGAEQNWSQEQQDLWNVIDAIATAHAPEAVAQPNEEDYEGWVTELEEKISQL